MRPLRAGVIGLGVGEQHAAAYERLPGCVLSVVCDASPERLASTSQRFPSARATTRPEDVLADPAVDIVSIASYDQDHFAQAMAALNAGKHVFVEKPLARSREELRALKSAWDSRRHLKLASNLVLRTAPLYNWLRSEIADGRLGRLFALDGDYLYGRLEKITDGWRRSVLDYSVMQGGGVHMVDLLLWLARERPLSVAASGNRISTEGTSFRYDDYVTAQFRFASGLVGRIAANFGCVHRHQHALRVFGTRATVLYDDMGPRLYSSREPGVPPTALSALALPESKAELIALFVDAILAGRDTAVETQHEFDVVSACVAADEARRKDCFVSIEYV